jgi:hypothetical protein
MKIALTSIWSLRPIIERSVCRFLPSTENLVLASRTIPLVTNAARRVQIAACVAAAAFTMQVGPFTSTARADAWDCLAGAVKASFNPKNFKEGGEFEIKYGLQCDAYVFSPTPAFAIIAGVVAVAMADNYLPDDAEKCINILPNKGAELILSIADDLGIDVPPDIKAAVDSGVQSEAQSAYNELVQNNPILEAFSCACAVDAYGKDAIEEYLNAAKACSGTFHDIVSVVVGLGGAVVGAAENMPCAFIPPLCPEGCGTAGAPCQGSSCPMGQQCYQINPVTLQPTPEYQPVDPMNAGYEDPNKPPFNFNQGCALCGLITNAVPKAPGVCGCSGGFLPNYQTYCDRPKELKSCDCPAPFSAYYDPAKKGNVCACPQGQSLIAGKCDLICEPNQIATKTPVMVNVPTWGGLKSETQDHWSCEWCPPNQKSDGHGSCKLICKPNERVVYKTVSVGGGPLKTTKTTESCEPCAEGTKSDGEGACIPCGDNAFVARGQCKSCGPWQKVSYSTAGIHSLSIGHCTDICPNGVLAIPNAPPSGPSRQSFKPPGGSPQKAITSLPGQGRQTGAPAGSANEVAKASGPAGGSGGAAAGGGNLAAPAKVPPLCFPCGPNEYSANNRCHDCGDKAVANIAARSCTSCAPGQIVKTIGGAPACAADCSKVDVGKKLDSKRHILSTNYITDPKDLSQCVPCAKGTRPNATHTACLFRGRLSLPQSSLPRQKKKRAKAVSKRTPPKISPGPPDVGKRTAKISCGPRSHPNRSGTGCVPDLDIPGLGESGVGAPLPGGGGPRGGPVGTPMLVRPSR